MAKYQVANHVGGTVVFSEVKRKDAKTGRIGPLTAKRGDVIELSDDEFRKLFETEGTCYHKSLVVPFVKGAAAKAPDPKDVGNEGGKVPGPKDPMPLGAGLPDNGKGDR